MLLTNIYIIIELLVILICIVLARKIGGWNQSSLFVHKENVDKTLQKLLLFGEMWYEL